MTELLIFKFMKKKNMRGSLKRFLLSTVPGFTVADIIKANQNFERKKYEVPHNKTGEIVISFQLGKKVITSHYDTDKINEAYKKALESLTLDKTVDASHI